MISDKQAVQFATNALTYDGGNAPPGVVAALFGCALLETGFGYYWKGEGVGSYNQGAIQAGSRWTGATFQYRDTHPNPDGTSTTYVTKFRKYPHEITGWVDLVRVMYGASRITVLRAAEALDWAGVSLAMYNTHYYEGYGKTPAERVANHARLLGKCIRRALAVLDQPIPTEFRPQIEIPATVRFGATGEHVKLAQRELQVVADGIFGRVSLAAAKQYQRQHGLVDDGVIGPVTWRTLLTDDFVPVAA